MTDNNIPPTLLFNLDETSINFTQKTKEHIIITRSHQARLLSHPDRMVSSTLVLCIPADGYALDSTLIWPQSNTPEEFRTFPLKHIRVYCQKSSYQTRASFTDMMLTYYLPEMLRRRDCLHLNKTPILLILDGHTSRLSTQVIQYCRTNNIILLILPSHTSHLTQPLDCCVNGTLKNVFASFASKAMNHPSKEDIAKKEEFIDAEVKSEEATNHETTEDSMKQTKKPDTTEREEEDNISDVSDEEASEEKVPPIPDDCLAFLGRKDYSESASSQRRLMAYALPLALEKATSYSSMEFSWKKAGLYPYNPSTILTQLREGDLPAIVKGHTPSISGKILTDSAMMVEIWTWRIQTLHKELKKATSPQQKETIEEEIRAREAELESMLTEGKQKEAPHEEQQKPQDDTISQTKEGENEEQKSNPIPNRKIETKSKIPQRPRPALIGSQVDVGKPPSITKDNNKSEDEETPSQDNSNQHIIDDGDQLVDSKEGSDTRTVLVESHEKRLMSEECMDSALETSSVGLQLDSQPHRYGLRTTRGQKRLPWDMTIW